jgi:hypoxanthine phosphoribosyltransferase
VHEDLECILISAEQLQHRIKELGEQITADYAGTDLLLVGVLKGAVVFMVDLARHIRLPVELDFMAVSSYGRSTESSGIVRILKDLDTSVEGRHVLVVEDIIDTGLSLRYIIEHLLNQRPASLRICALLNKQKARKADVTVDYIGFSIPDRFVVGYGLDYAEVYRNLPYVGILKAEVAQRARRNGVASGTGSVAARPARRDR